MQLGKIYSGFELKREQNVEELNSLARVFVHKKTGARLIHIENDDTNKVFSISFKTPSYNNTGLPHILEHSVLCGSKKFPTKDPFLELIKSSLKTFLNAFTYPDKTVYPVASKNEKDFFNLMEVYLDAVFFPNIYDKKEIFLQEGWCYDTDEKRINGVVYNEMKGAYSSPERVLDSLILSSLYSDTSYAFDSGGYPEDIPKLSYEEFTKFHKTHYHPSNSYIFLYGNGDIKKQLDFLNEKYLAKFVKKNLKPALGIQKPFKELKRIKSFYNISRDIEKEKKSYFALNFSSANANIIERFALGIIMYYLMGTKSAPLKKALLQEKIGEDVFGHFEEDVAYPYLSFCVKNTSVEKEKRFFDILFQTLEKISKEGFDMDLLKACINSFEFRYLEADFDQYPKGLVYNLEILKNWLYGKEPFEVLEYKIIFKKLRKFLKEGYFEDLIEKYILKNTHSSFVLLEPKKGSLKETKVDFDEADFLKLKKYQKTSDTSKDIAKIPKLTKSDVDSQAEIIPKHERVVKGTPFLYNPLDANGIYYVNLVFNTKVVPLKNLHALTILCMLLGRVGTKKFTYSQLDVLIQKYTGGISFKRKCFVSQKQNYNYTPRLYVKSKAFERNFSKMNEIVLEIIQNSRFDEKEHIREILLERKSRIERSISQEGTDFATSRVVSYFSEYGKYEEYTNGLPFYAFLCDLLENFEKRWCSFKGELDVLLSLVFNTNDLMVNIVGEKDLVFEGLDILKSLSNAQQDYTFELEGVNEGVVTESSVQFVAQGGNFLDLGFTYTGKLLVLRSVLSREYLWNILRVEGGAYGAFCHFGRSGNSFFASYRDPHIIRTLKAYANMPSFLENFKVNDFDKYIVGTIAGLDTVLTPNMKGEKALAMRFSGVEDCDLQQERDDVLQTKVTDIGEFSELLASLVARDFFCVFGSNAEITKNKDLFKRILKPLE